ncbi:hypothetical protein KC345_g4303 [Hortaea werneckii]|nr:hypothetical protein KC345_g4303 [Hortaea werneckii]
MNSRQEELQRLGEQVQQAVRKHGSSGDPAAYDDALSAIQRLQLAVEKPGDYIARLRFQGLQNIAIIMLAEMGVLQCIVERKGQTVTADDLANQTGSDSLLIRRLMRLMTAIGVCEEKGEYTYQSNCMTEVLAVPGQIAGMRYMTETLFPIGSKIREYMSDAGAKNGLPQSLPACKFAFRKTFWQLLDDEADRRASFNEYMKAARRGGQAQVWHERYPPAAKLKDEKLRDDPDALLMVDVGGGVGGQVSAFRQQYAGLPGRCVLQDLPDTIKNNASPPANVELMAYDFFTPQPLKGARMYLFRSVCHDWDDEHTRKLLSNTVAAMDPTYSRLLIDDWVLPESGASLKAANMDINMGLMFNAMERTKGQGEKLLGDVGLEIVEIFSSPGAAEAVIEAKVKQ